MDDLGNLRTLDTTETEAGSHPNQVLAEVLGYCQRGIPDEEGESAAEVESVVVIYRGDDGLLDLSWSNMPTGDLCEMAMFFMARAQKVAEGRDACEIESEPEPSPESS